MGTPGVPWEVPREKIEQALKKQKGRLTYACKDLNCTYRVLKKHIDEHPDLQELLVRLRNEFDCTLLDMAESSLVRGMSESDPNAYLRSAFYVLNHKGKDRGYNHPEALAQKNSPADIIEAYKTGKLSQPDTIDP